MKILEIYIVDRLYSVDVFRTLAIIAVIAIHTSPFESTPIGTTLDLATVVNQFSRFAVPLFFTLSGYFWAYKLKGEKDIWLPSMRVLKRISFIFLAWSVIYIFPMNIYDTLSNGMLEPLKLMYWSANRLVNSPLVALMQGTARHLWFLVGLICSIAISAIFIRLQMKSFLIVFAVGLYIIGLAGKAYQNTALGFHADFNLRNGPFFALIFFVTGYFLQSCRINKSWFVIGLLVAIFGLLLHFSEIYFLNQYYLTTMDQDYVIGTYFFGIGMSMIALSNKSYLKSPIIASIGPLVPGIYASHEMFIQLMTPFKRILAGNTMWDIPFLALIFILSYVFSLTLSKFSYTKRLVV